MSDEDAFQARLDADPNDHGARMVFADWLEEQGDPRAEGYRALGALGKSPFPPYGLGKDGYWTWGTYRVDNEPDYSDLSPDWFDAIGLPASQVNDANYGNWAQWPTRRTADDAAALAWSCLSPERRAELLAGVPA